MARSKPDRKSPDFAGSQGTIRLLQDGPTFADLLSHPFSLGEDPVDQLFNSTEKRLVRMLLLLADFEKGGQAQPVIPKISPETLAEIIGTTPSRVNFFMNKFRKLELIE
jgi:CRP/FNR family cyclic AMP-dependent transcriptional regulator